MNIVITNKSVNIAGGENYVLYLASGLRKRNHNVIIAPLTNSELAAKSKELGYETIEMDYSAKGLDEIPLIFDFAKKLNNKKIDIIHTNSNTDRTIGAFASKFLDCKNVAQIHSHFSVKQRSHHTFRNKLIDHFITDSESSRSQLVDLDKTNPNKVTTVHIGIPEDNKIIPEETKISLRKEFGIQPNEIIIGTIGRLVPFKGHCFLIRSLKNILVEHPNAKLMIVGNGEIQEELVALTSKLGISDKVIFTGYRTDVDELLSIFNIYTHPSLDHGGESFPIAVLLALKAGLPIIASKVSDIPVQVKNGFNGFIVDPGNAEQLSIKISELLKDAVLKQIFASNSFKHFQNNFTLDKMIDKIESLYQKVIQESVSPNSRKNKNYLLDLMKRFFTKQREVF